MSRKTFKSFLAEGFTIIEVLIVVAITILLSSSLITYTSTARQQIALYAEEAKLGQTIYRAKSLALSSRSMTVGSQQICGYGVHFDYDYMKYSIFSYLKPQNLNCKDISAIDGNYENTISTFNVNKNLKLVPAEKGIYDVLFIPPDPLTLMRTEGGTVNNGSAAAILKTADGSLYFTITVNSNGLVDF